MQERTSTFMISLMVCSFNTLISLRMSQLLPELEHSQQEGMLMHMNCWLLFRHHHRHHRRSCALPMAFLLLLSGGGSLTTLTHKIVYCNSYSRKRKFWTTHYSHSQNSLLQLILTKTQILDDLIVVEQQHQLVCHHHHIIISKLHL